MVAPKIQGPRSPFVHGAQAAGTAAGSMVADTATATSPSPLRAGDTTNPLVCRPDNQSIEHPLLTGNITSDNLLSAERHRVEVTLGTEYEWQQTSDSESTLFGTSINGMILLADSNFRELFAFHGRDDDGVWIQNLIPKCMLQLDGFRRLVSKNADLFVKQGEDIYIDDARWKKLDPIRLFATMKVIFEARGRYETDLKIRKIQKAWEEKQDRYSRMIPNEVAEEWREGPVRNPLTEEYENVVRFVNIEFPMTGGVASYSEIQEYIRVLATHLNIHEEGIEERIHAHVNWVARINAVEDPRLRLRLYRAVKGYLGEINDRAAVYELARYVLHGGSAVFSDYPSFLVSILGLAEQYIFSILTRETFDRLIATPEGFLVKDRNVDLKPRVEPNFPFVFKCLPLALRSLGLKRYENPSTPLPLFRLEARTVGNTIRENFAALPPTVPGTSYLDTAALLQYDHEYSAAHSKGATVGCGLMSGKALILRRLNQLGLSEDVYAFVERAIERKDGVYEFMNRDPQIFQMKSNELIALMLLPVNDWLNHPRVVRHLDSLSEERREAAVLKFNEALDRYKRRMSMVVNAVRNAQVGSLPHDIRTKMKLDPEALREGDYNMFFVAGETGRFVLDSGLLDLMN